MQGPASVTAPYRGVISGPYHLQPELDRAYRDTLREAIAPGGPFTVENIEPELRSLRDLLLEDLALQEAYMGAPRDQRRGVINQAYTQILAHVAATKARLDAELGPGE